MPNCFNMTSVKFKNLICNLNSNRFKRGHVIVYEFRALRYTHTILNKCYYTEHTIQTILEVYISNQSTVFKNNNTMSNNKGAVYFVAEI